MYENAVLDEQSNHIMWRMDVPVDLGWAADFRSAMYEVFFSNETTQGRVCFVGSTYGYVL